MRSVIILFCSLLVMFLIPYASIFADSLSYLGGIISSGDKSFDVFTKCGSPDWKESHQEEISQRLDGDMRQKVYVTVEEWTYNFEPNQFIRTVILKNGRVCKNTNW